MGETPGARPARADACGKAGIADDSDGDDDDDAGGGCCLRPNDDGYASVEPMGETFRAIVSGAEGER